jgi:hypothetical protein
MRQDEFGVPRIWFHTVMVKVIIEQGCEWAAADVNTGMLFE